MSKSNLSYSQSGLLILSNGHGEDAIALRIVKQIQQQSTVEIVALPIVGEGRLYRELNIPLIGAVQVLPSGGFLYMDGKQLMRDVNGGLLQLTLSQIKAVRSWTRSPGGGKKMILAVGDLVPLLFAWLSGADYAFVGTAKSEYYVRDEAGVLPRKSRRAWWENFSGSIYHPWERWLMSRPRCKAVFPRDTLTTEILQKWSIPTFDLGNPMMDNLEPVIAPRFYAANAQQQETARPLVITLIPGSRPPEAYENWTLILMAVGSLLVNFRDRSLVFLGAIAPGLDCNTIQQILESQGWIPCGADDVSLGDPKTLTFKQKGAALTITQTAFNDCLHQADLAIAMAGTATEQFVGLGKPAVAIVGQGQQFNPLFAEAQSRHLGISVILIDKPNQAAKALESLLQDPDRLQLIAENGVRRMGKPGAAKRIAESVLNCIS